MTEVHTLNYNAPSYGIVWKHSETFARVEVHGRPLPNQFISLLWRIEAESDGIDGKSLLLDLQRMARPLGLAERRLIVNEVTRTLWHVDRIALLLPSSQADCGGQEGIATEVGGSVQVFSWECDALDWLLGLMREPAL